MNFSLVFIWLCVNYYFSIILEHLSWFSIIFPNGQAHQINYQTHISPLLTHPGGLPWVLFSPLRLTHFLCSSDVHVLSFSIALCCILWLLDAILPLLCWKIHSFSYQRKVVLKVTFFSMACVKYFYLVFILFDILRKYGDLG